eukprot:TRINITY_DN47913_c0_g1_i1.p1 TRINITY_DN47913_c0_g1~~TRINITY_DN47913_c0_g1_i1.p1  ORF type:complete len:296 (+),score=77.54 TRINITY_DN47913_c0_g1_i1:95-889(+)
MSIAPPAGWAPCAELKSYTPLLPVIAELLAEKMRSSGPTVLPTSPQRAQMGYKLTVFDSSVMPGLPIEQYIIHLTQHSRGSPCMWIAMWTLICRIEEVGGVAFTPLRAHRMLLAAALVASKITDDYGRSNRTYSTLGGVQLPEMNSLEQAVLQNVDWRTNCSAADWEASVGTLVSAGRNRNLLNCRPIDRHVLFPATFYVPFASGHSPRLQSRGSPGCGTPGGSRRSSRPGSARATAGRSTTPRGSGRNAAVRPGRRFETGALG